METSELNKHNRYFIEGYRDFYTNQDINPYPPDLTHRDMDWKEGWTHARQEWLEASIDIEMY